MFDEKVLRRSHCVTTVEMLLWNINENLRALQAEMSELAASKVTPSPAQAPEKEPEKAPEKKLEEPKNDGGQPDGLLHCPVCEFKCKAQAKLLEHYKGEHPDINPKG